MTNEEFTALVGRLEAAAQRDPGAYQSRALMLALAGNAYLAGIVALLLASIVGMVAMIAVLKFVAVKVAFVLGGFLLVVLRAAWIRLPPPQGIEVTRADAPRLFELIDGLRSARRPSTTCWSPTSSMPRSARSHASACWRGPETTCCWACR